MTSSIHYYKRKKKKRKECVHKDYNLIHFYMNVCIRSGKLNFSFTANKFCNFMSKKKSVYILRAIDGENINKNEKKKLNNAI